MKYIIILGDGMADEPIEALGGKTPLQVAKKPYIDMLAAKGKNGLLDTIPEGFKPGSEIANLSVLGYDVPKVFEGRGSLEAASIGVDIEPGEMAMRCNIICIEDGKIKNHSAGHISTEEATELITFLDKELNDGEVSLYPGVSYRHLLKLKGGNKNLDCTAPHDVMGTPFKDVMIKATTEDAEETAAYLNNLIIKSQELLKNHPVNLKRIAEGKDPANSIWPWSPGYRPQMETLQQLYGIKSGSVISAVDLIMGIGVYAGLKLIHVEGATGLYDTNYEGKAQAAIDALKNDDFVYLHIEASDEAGHEGDYELKTKTIEYLDQRVVKTIYEATKDWDEPVAIAILPDHPTPCAIKTHTNKPVPFIIYRPDAEGDSVQMYDEFESAKGAYGMLKGPEFMETFLKKQ
ncbi:cofactor-independent phosphoglycerate mutase [Dysgonomonas sp. 216]|uniref:cofactor-independent phosphoglycerate mutase n=1 Tax=Dysgonomonas sp. 216 TaxID=2302934 RepID=UPI0013D58673|nr:cofactor-independent phosphoglycerate mutase [Dysgonomonas sp. 216]NDW18294.1 cofactor-independent phosphoglycerate mutase [Dysgonomonas sp. 216]NDW18662.1 cofactor-independent phosphoglycerate mutase [Dysgonomonas sp. 216]